MKKRIWSTLLITMMLIMSMSAMAFAADSEMSDEFKALLNEEGKLVMKSFEPTTEEEFAGIFTVLYGDKYGADYSTVSENFSSVDLTICRNETWETHVVDIVYEYDEEIKKIAAELTKDIDPNKVYHVRDLELINYWVNGRDTMDANTSEEFFEFANDINNYSSEFQTMINYKNFTLNIQNNAGEGDPLYTKRCGIATFVFDGVVYYVNSYTELNANHIIYVPDDTADTKEALLEAAQKRINEYLGSETTVVLNYEGPAFKEDVESAFGITDVEHCYSVTVNGVKKPYSLLIIPDSEKMYVPEHRTSDINTDIEVSTKDSSVPLDTKIEAEKLEEGAEYEKIVKLVNKENSETYDIKLFSTSTEKYVTKLEDGSFEVKIPVAESMKGKELVVYYVDANDKIVEYDVTVKDGYAVFITDHFSIYTLAEDDSDIQNGEGNNDIQNNENNNQSSAEGSTSPKTGDGLGFVFWSMLLVVSGVIVSFLWKKEKCERNLVQ